jgi:hypothetical protein
MEGEAFEALLPAAASQGNSNAAACGATWVSSHLLGWRLQSTAVNYWRGSIIGAAACSCCTQGSGDAASPGGSWLFYTVYESLCTCKCAATKVIAPSTGGSAWRYCFKSCTCGGAHLCCGRG